MNGYIGFEDIHQDQRVVGTGWWEGHLAGSFTARHTSGFSLHRPTLHPTAIPPDQRTYNATAGDGEKMQQKLGDNSNSNHGRLINGQTPSG